MIQMKDIELQNYAVTATDRQYNSEDTGHGNRSFKYSGHNSAKP